MRRDLASEPAVPIVYGLPGPELFEEADRGAVILGGCCVVVDAPMANVGCLTCGTEWHEPRADGEPRRDP
ncbi:MAG TPA: hypothetical protein VFU93_00820 [Acidimicrobiales bacterium]|nr:hypothetical protein [Acidimicrobiales bacterium]